MTTNLLRAEWADHIDSSELRFVLLEVLGKPGQYDSRVSNFNTFYLPLAGESCRVKLVFSDAKEFVSIEAGPAFDAALWEQVVQEVERTDRIRIGREYSFSSFRVPGSWVGSRSGMQILPPPANAPVAPVEIAEHPFILEFPIKFSDSRPVTNFRRMREHRELTSVLNILLAGRVTVQPRRLRHFWAVDPQGESQEVKWVQESYFAKLGGAVREDLSPPSSRTLRQVDPDEYYARVGHDGRSLEVPADLDDSISCFMSLSTGDRDKFGRAAFWMDLSSRQWEISASASFASLAIAIEALGERASGASVRFRNFIERYAPGASLASRRREMYAMRSDILHGTGLMEIDRDTQLGWAPPEHKENELMYELSGLARIAVRNWLKGQAGR